MDPPDQARKEHAEAERLRDRLAAVLRAEQRDVERLDGVSFARLYHTILGTSELARQAEQAEADRAAEALAEAEAKVQEAARRVAELEGRASAEQAAHARRLQQVEQRVASLGDAVPPDVAALLEERAVLEAVQAELQALSEARDEVSVAANALRVIAERSEERPHRHLLDHVTLLRERLEALLPRVRRTDLPERDELAAELDRVSQDFGNGAGLDIDLAEVIEEMLRPRGSESARDRGVRHAALRIQNVALGVDAVLLRLGRSIGRALDRCHEAQVDVVARAAAALAA